MTREFSVSARSVSRPLQRVLMSVLFVGVTNAAALAQSPPDGGAAPQNGQPAPVAPDATTSSQWQYGAFIDGAFIGNPDDPANHLFRSRGTTWHENNWYINMAGIYAKKKPTEQSRWGAEILAQDGKDDEIFGYSATAPNLKGAEGLRHLGLANVSYLAPVGLSLIHI